MKKNISVDFKQSMYRSRFLLPNLVTIGNMFCGFLAIVYAAQGKFDKAVIAVFAGIILDGLDGKIARRFNASSKFGVEFDSLSDLVTFGIAPAFLMYEWCFREFADEFGVLVCFIYASSVAARLARFNISDPNIKTFTGLASPAGAAMVVSTINMFPDLNLKEISVAIATVYLLVISFLMVSNYEYPSLKQLKLNSLHLQYLLIFAAIIAFLWYKPRVTVFIISLVYCISGPLLKVSWVRSKFPTIPDEESEQEEVA